MERRELLLAASGIALTGIGFAAAGSGVRAIGGGSGCAAGAARGTASDLAACAFPTTPKKIPRIKNIKIRFCFFIFNLFQALC